MRTPHTGSGSSESQFVTRVDSPADDESAGSRQSLENKLRAAAHGTRRGLSSTFVIAGRSGMGKTHLTQRLLALGSEAGVTGAVGRCHEVNATPLGPILPVLRRIQSVSHDPHLTTLFNDLRQSSTLSEDVGVGFLAMDIVDTLVESIKDHPTMIVIEDLHWADHATLNVVESLVDEINVGPRRTPLMLLLTSRSEAPSASRNLWRIIDASPNGTVSRLSPMSEMEINDLIRETLGGPPSTQLLDLVMSMCDGIPLHAVAVLRAIREGGLFDPARDVVDTKHIASRLAELSEPSNRLETFIDAAGESNRGVLGALAVLTDWQASGTLADVSQEPEERVRSALDRAASEGFVDRQDDFWTFAHPTFRTAVYLSMPPPQRHRFHGRCVELLDGVDSDAVEMGTHAMLAGPAIPAERRLLITQKGGDRALALGSWKQAEQLFSHAMVCAQALGRDEKDVAPLRLSAAIAAYEMADTRRSLRHFETTIQHARSVGDNETWARASIAAARCQLTVDTDAKDKAPGLVALAEVAALDDLSTGTRAEIHGLHAELLATANLLIEAAPHADLAIELAEEVGDFRVLGRALFAKALLAMGGLALDDARDLFQRAAAAGEQADDRQLQLWVATRGALVDLMAGRLADAAKALRTSFDSAIGQRNWAECSIAAALSIPVALAGGRFDQIESTAANCASQFSRAEYVLTPLILHPSLARFRALRGDHDGAIEALTMLDPEPRAGRSGRGLSHLAIDVMGGLGVAHAPSQIRERQGPMTAYELGHLVAMSLVAVASEDTAGCELLIPHLAQVVESGVKFSPADGQSLSRTLAHVTAFAGDPETSRRLYRQAEADCAAAGADLEGVLCAVGLAGLDATDSTPMMRTVSGLDQAERYCNDHDLIAVGSEIQRVRDGMGLRPARLSPSTAAAVGHKYRAVMFTDVVGSTDIGVRFGDEVYLRTVRRHDEIVRAQLAEFGAFLFDTAGDGLLAWHNDPSSLVKCALAVLREVEAAEAPPGEPELMVSIGIADGTPIDQEGDLFGTTVNLASRMVSLASSNECLVTGSLRARVDSTVVQFVKSGEHIPKGFTEPIHTYRAIDAQTQRRK